MKGKIGWIIGTIETIIGFACFFVAQMEISSNSRYTWRKPYSSHEAQVLMTKWIGIAFLISGIVWLGLKIYQARYTNKHTQEMNPVVKNGGTTKCLNCGLALTAGAESCPRCGNAVKEISGNSNYGSERTCFCGKCGNSIRADEQFCSKCGQKIIL